MTPPVNIKSEEREEEVAAEPNPILVERSLDRIALSAEFARSERMVEFLRYIVAAALAGRRDDLTERSIGRDVFGRPGNWDPSLDTIVRSEARRLRQKLGSYYDGLGSTDALRIDLPKGRYAPEFRAIEAEPALQPATELVLGASVSLSPQASPSTARVLSRYLIAGCLFLVLVAAWVFLRHRAPAPNQLASAAFTTTPFTSDIGKEFSPSLSPDGRTVAYVWDNESDPPDIYLRGLEEPSARRLALVAGTRLFPSWSPDGKSLAFFEVSGQDVYLTVHTLQDGSERRIGHIARQVGRWAEDESPLLGDPGPVWMPDGKSLVFSDHDTTPGSGGIFRTDLAQHRTLLIAATGEEHYLYPRLSSDGSQLAFARYSSHGVSDLFLVAKPGAAPRQITFDQKTIRGLAWLADGHSLLFSSNRSGSFQLWLIDLRSGALTSVATNSSSAAEPALSPSGDSIVYVESNQNWNIWRSALNGSTLGNPERLVASSGRNYDPRYSPDGGRIAFVSDRSGSMELWVADAENRNPQQITHLGSPWLGGISWSPRGDQIAFDARPEGRSAIFLVDPKGGVPKPIDKNPYEERMPAWSHNGDAIYFNSNRDGAIAIWRRSLVDGKVTRVSEHEMFAVAASTGSLISSTRSGVLWTSELDGREARQLEGSPRVAPVMSWYLQGENLYVAEADDSSHDYRFLRRRAGRWETLGRSGGLLVPNAPDISASPDGRWFLFARQDSSGSDLKIRRLVTPPRTRP